MSILIVGANGNMASRYKSILKSLDITYTGTDIQQDMETTLELAHKSDGVIIATPTDTHLEIIQELSQAGVKILCEKPLTKDPKRLDKLSKTTRSNLTMVYQYSEIVDPNLTPDWTLYDYFKHGTDGLVWDCIQIIGLAKGDLSLDERSPVWRCFINGKKLSLSDMDMAYVKFIKAWISGRKQDFGAIRDAHFKTQEIERTSAHGLNH